MKSVAPIRYACTMLAVIALLGGYAVNQYMTIIGPSALQEWTALVRTPNLILGWILLCIGIVLTLFREPAGDSKK